MFAATCFALAPFASANGPVSAVGSPSAAERPSAVEQFQHLQQNLKRDKSHGDWKTYLQDAQRLKLF
jgi:hypothetical protein